MPKPRLRVAKPSAPDRLFVDSGAWLALFSARDQHHLEADALFREAVSRRIPLVTTNLVLAEVHRLLLYRAGIAPAARALLTLEKSEHLRIEFAAKPLHQAALAWLARLGDQQITYTDAVSFAVMDAEKCRTALSFDADFTIAGFQLFQR